MKIEILTKFHQPLFAAYDIVELEVAVVLAQHSAETLRFRVLLDIKDRWEYHGESGFDVPPEVWLVDPADRAYDIAGDGSLARTFTLELNQNLLDGLKDFASEPLWADELHYQLVVECILQAGDEETREWTRLDLPNPWHPSFASAPQPRG